MADPRTCRHWVLEAWISTKILGLVVKCASCGTDLSDPKTREGKIYRYDEHHRLWILSAARGKRVERTQTPEGTNK
jgi:hypothetical protein